MPRHDKEPDAMYHGGLRGGLGKAWLDEVLPLLPLRGGDVEKDPSDKHFSP